MNAEQPSSNETHQQEFIIAQPRLNPVICYTIIAITVGIYLLQTVSQLYLNRDIPAAIGMKINAYIILGEWWRLITPVFLHGSIFHLLFNMYALYALGPGLERYYGHLRFLILYLLSGFAGNVVSFAFSPARSLGASTAIFGLLAAEGVFIYHNRKIFGAPAQQALVNIVSIALINFVIGFSPGIDNFGHLGGFLAGLGVAWLGGPILQIKAEHKESKPHLTLYNARSQRDFLFAAISVGILFGVIAILRVLLVG